MPPLEKPEKPARGGKGRAGKATTAETDDSEQRELERLNNEEKVDGLILDRRINLIEATKAAGKISLDQEYTLLLLDNLDTKRGRAGLLPAEDGGRRRRRQRAAEIARAGPRRRAEADTLYFAFVPKKRRHLWDIEARRPAGRIGALYAEAAALDAQLVAVLDQILTTKATTIAGVVAQLEFFTVGMEDDWIPIVMAGLRDLDSRSAAGEYRPAEPPPPQVVGFGPL